MGNSEGGCPNSRVRDSEVWAMNLVGAATTAPRGLWLVWPLTSLRLEERRPELIFLGHITDTGNSIHPRGDKKKR